MSVGKLAILYLEHARRRYGKAGKETSEVHIVQAALRFIVKNHRDLPASKFSPRSLKAVREEMIEAGLARTTINALVTRIRRMYRWAVGEEIVDERLRVLEKLKAVPDLRADSGEARETAPVKPAPDSFVDSIKPHVRPAVWALVELQRVTGMRPGEVLIRFFPHYRGSLSQGLRVQGEFAAEEEDAGAVVFEVTEAAGG